MHKTSKKEKTSSQRAYSLSPIPSPKSSRAARNTFKTAPNSPVNLKKTFKQKHVISSPTGKKRVCRSQAISADDPLPSQPKSTEVSPMASAGTSSSNKKPVPETSCQKYRKLSFTDENCEKIKIIRCIVSNMSPTEKALLARKRMMMKLASEQHIRQAPGDLHNDNGLR